MLEAERETVDLIGGVCIVHDPKPLCEREPLEIRLARLPVLAGKEIEVGNIPSDVPRSRKRNTRMLIEYRYRSFHIRYCGLCFTCTIERRGEAIECIDERGVICAGDALSKL